MIFHSTKIPGVFEIELELKEDERGYFTRIFCEEELKRHGVEFRVRQSNRSFSKTKGTLRGLHFQKNLKWEAKLMTALRGSFYTVVADLRPQSLTFKQWLSVELSAEKKNMLLTPIGCANGFQTLEDNSDMLYFMSEFYSPEHQSGVSYKDPELAIAWPMAPSVVSEKDTRLLNLADLSL